MLKIKTVDGKFFTFVGLESLCLSMEFVAEDNKYVISLFIKSPIQDIPSRLILEACDTKKEAVTKYNAISDKIYAGQITIY